MCLCVRKEGKGMLEQGQAAPMFRQLQTGSTLCRFYKIRAHASYHRLSPTPPTLPFTSGPQPCGVRTSSRWLPPRFLRATGLLPHPQTTPQIGSRFLYGLGLGGGLIGLR